MWKFLDLHWSKPFCTERQKRNSPPEPSESVANLSRGVVNLSETVDNLSENVTNIRGNVFNLQDLSLIFQESLIRRERLLFSFCRINDCYRTSSKCRTAGVLAIKNQLIWHVHTKLIVDLVYIVSTSSLMS